MFVFKITDSNSSFNEHVDAIDIEQAYQMMYEEYPDATIECLEILNNEEI